MKIKYSIIVPFYNEEKNILNLHKEIQNMKKKNKLNAELIYVNDGSTDNTENILSTLRTKYIHIINLTRNFGQTAAIQAGIDKSIGDIIILLDGDGQNDPNDIPKLINKLKEGYDVVSGWRKNRKDTYLTRILPSKIANKIISNLSGVKLNDYGCSLKIYNKNIIKMIRLYGDMHRFIPIYANWMGGKIIELPVNHRKRNFGYSKYNINRTVQVLLDLIFIVFFNKFLTKPIQAFGMVGLFLFLISIIVFIYSIILKFFYGVSFVSTPLLLITCMFFIVSIVIICMGILAELIIRTYFESQNKNIYFKKD